MEASGPLLCLLTLRPPLLLRLISEQKELSGIRSGNQKRETIKVGERTFPGKVRVFVVRDPGRRCFTRDGP